MAEPDYLEGDCDELIKPKKLINPVKNSRNHQDLHRELLMNQKRLGDAQKHICSTSIGGKAVLLQMFPNYHFCQSWRRLVYFNFQWRINRHHPCCSPLIGLIVSMQHALVLLHCHLDDFTNPIPPPAAVLCKALAMKLSYKLLHKAFVCRILVMQISHRYAVQN